MKDFFKAFLVFFVMLGATALAVTASWKAPITYTDGTPITEPLTYKLYAGPCGQPKVLIATTTALSKDIIPAPTSVTCYAVTASGAANLESDPSADYRYTPPPPQPAPPGPVSGTDPRVVAVSPGLYHSPVYRILLSGARSTVAAGHVAVGKSCIGAVVFTYRGKKYRRVDQNDVIWWDTPKTPEAAAACAP